MQKREKKKREENKINYSFGSTTISHNKSSSLST
jgi:hypothetical protein